MDHEANRCFDVKSDCTYSRLQQTIDQKYGFPCEVIWLDPEEDIEIVVDCDSVLKRAFTHALKTIEQDKVKIRLIVAPKHRPYSGAQESVKFQCMECGGLFNREGTSVTPDFCYGCQAQPELPQRIFTSPQSNTSKRKFF
jgi:hypothetical protein